MGKSGVIDSKHNEFGRLPVYCQDTLPTAVINVSFQRYKIERV